MFGLILVNFLPLNNFPKKYPPTSDETVIVKTNNKNILLLKLLLVKMTHTYNVIVVTKIKLHDKIKYNLILLFVNILLNI